jgi:hypothetical protein
MKQRTITTHLLDLISASKPAKASEFRSTYPVAFEDAMKRGLLNTWQEDGVEFVEVERDPAGWALKGGAA